MTSSTQYTVAVELGFPEELVGKALREKKFKNAGELVDYLDTIEEEKTEMKTAVVGAEGGEQPTTDENSLRKETETLYRLSLCLACWKRPRTIVILPCSHYTLCNVCASLKDRCPLRDCNEKIMDIIQTFL